MENKRQTRSISTSTGAHGPCHETWIKSTIWQCLTITCSYQVDGIFSFQQGFRHDTKYFHFHLCTFSSSGFNKRTIEISSTLKVLKINSYTTSDMQLSNIRIISIILLLVEIGSGFVPRPLTPIRNHPGASGTSTTSRFVVDQAFPVVDQFVSLSIEEIKAARAAFVLCFFGAVGTASLGREVIPKTWSQWQSTKKLVGSGKGSGGKEMDLFGYPEPVYVNDVLQILNNNLTATEIEQEYPGKYPGYLQFESLAAANQEVSPMAVRAVFDSLSIGINKNQIIPLKAERVFEVYRSDFEQMEKNIRLGKIIGVAAFVVLVTLLGLADFFALYHLLRGWFPDWQGLSGLPVSLLDERGFSNLANCFVADDI